MADPIDRQAAIDVVSKACQEWRGIFGRCEDGLLALPSAQPEIIRCKDCLHHHYEKGEIPYCDRIDYGYGWKDDEYCSRGERREK